MNNSNKNNNDNEINSNNSNENNYNSESESQNSENKSNANPIDDSTISGRIERAMSIKQAVNEKIQNKQHYMKLNEIPITIRQAIIAVEDSRFYSHSGFDLESIARATIVNVEAGQIEEGGSTITQQLVKNLFLSQEQSFTRKAEELVLSLNMERNFSKDEILELYLNTIYFGSSFYGIYDAAMGYFGKEPKDLTVAESAMLAGLPNAPSLYSPYVDFMLAKKRQLIVINAMVKAKILSESEAEKARIETINLVGTTN
ncbi:MAG: transglycosylase domain-containing protein [Selenomonadaceae bacterium]|nr:transglycosylase domain-containing protein [Selenomonadaceae bacterium]MBR1858971.1 transglycosylase domain-containing protein [Selenomonadaceae bacterium]